MSESKRAQNTAKMAEKPLDRFSQKKPVGRPWRVRPSEVSGRSYNLRLQFEQIWMRCVNLCWQRKQQRTY
jgi:hypothetical protein